MMANRKGFFPQRIIKGAARLTLFRFSVIKWIMDPSEQEKRRPWLHVLPCRGQPRLRLFCFPYAGASATVFYHWPRGLPPGVEVWAVQLPGRGARFRERPFCRLEELLDDLLPALLPGLRQPFVFFGHSMGALLAFETTRRLRRLGAALPVRLLVSARPAPALPPARAPIHQLADQEFLEELRFIGGTPEEAMDNPELMKLVLPSVRADFALVETYAYQDEPPLTTPITACGGVEDKRVPRDLLDGWRVETVGEFTLELFPGGHFYLNTDKQALLARLGQILLPGEG